MKQATILAVLLLAVLAPAAGAQGVNLSLDDCGAYGTENASPSCETNVGIALMVIGSVVPPAGMDSVVAVEADIEVCENHQSTVSPWWSLGGCRASALSFIFDFSEGPYNCNDFWAGQASGGGYTAPSLFPAPNRFRIRLVVALPYSMPMDPSLEHYVFKVRILRTKSTGEGACAGCGTPAALLLTRLWVYQPISAGDALLTSPIDRNYVTYNHGDPDWCIPVPALNRTWGQVKGLYR